MPMLKPSVYNCRACPLWESRTHIVDGAGNPGSPVMIVGEAPGEAEDKVGMPFQGRSGKLLRATLAENGMPDGSYYLTNVVKCRPPENRDPTSQETLACSGWFNEELTHVTPRVIIALGKHAQKALQQAALDGLLPEGVPVHHVVHPAYLLRAQGQRRSWALSLGSIGRSLGFLPGPNTGDDRSAIPAQVSSVPYLRGTPDPGAMYYAADTETDDLEEGYGVRTVGYSVSDGSRAAFRGGAYLAGQGDYADLRVLSRQQHTWLHNAKYDAESLGIDLRREQTWDDTMLIAYVLRYPRVGLKILSADVAGFPLEPISGIIGTGRKRIAFSQALRDTPHRARDYAAADAFATAKLAGILGPKISKIPVLDRYYRTVEKPAVRVIRDMEQRGALVDPDILQALSHELGEDITRLTVEQWQMFGCPSEKFNRASTQQLAQRFLADGLILTQKTPTGKWKLDDQVLESLLAQGHPAVAHERHIRRLTKLKSTYTDSLLEKRDAGSRVHARFNQAVTDTSRLSSSEPNLQNIPIRTPLGKRIRTAFIARPGYKILKADASQLEVRVYAEYTREPVLVDAYTHEDHDSRGKNSACLRCDVHQQVATELGIARDDAKNTLFAAIYGAEAERLASTAHVPADQTGPFLSRLRERLPSLLTYRDGIAEKLFTQNYVETLVGFRNYYPQYASVIRSERAAALREAGNCPIQGTGAGIIKVGMTEADALAQSYEAELVLTVHDEVVYEVPEGNVVMFARKLQELFREVALRWMKKIPFRLDTQAGDSWGNLNGI